MKRILFVEDNSLMRELFETLLAGESKRWEVTTSPGAEEALELMKRQSFDVVASDMRMNGMNGAELLNEVARLHPKTSRIIISGVADQAEAARIIGTTHQFLLKPFDFKTLQAVLSRINGLDAFLQDEKLRTLAGRLKVLPSFPMLYLEIMKAVDDPDSSLDVIDGLVIKDPALTAKVLQVVNSVSVGLSEKVSDPLRAIQHLGLNTVRSLALSAHVFSSFTPAQKINFPMDALWTHLMRCGDIARAIMRAEGAESAQADAAYTAALLHDIGKLMLADSLPADFQNVLTQAAMRDAPFYAIEMEVLGATHAGLAAYLLGLWGLPAAVVEAVAFHHTPEKSSHQEFSPLTAVHVADALEHEMHGDKAHLNLEYLAAIGVQKKLDAWREETRADQQ